MYKLETLLEDYDTGHSQFQQDYFITIQNGITLWGQYKQALRELSVRINNLKVLICDEKEARIREEQIKDMLKTETDKWEKQILELELIRKKLSTNDFEIALKSAKKEFTRFYQQACILKTKLEKNYGELTEKIKNELEKDLWETKFKQRIANEIVIQGKPSLGTYESINSLPQNIKQKVIEELKQPEKLINWNENSIEKYCFNEEELKQIDCSNLFNCLKFLEE